MIAWEGSDVGTSQLEIFASRWLPDGSLLGPYPIAVTAALNSQFDAGVAWTGDGYAVAYGDFRTDDVLQSHRGDLRAARIGRDGTVIDPDGFAFAADTIPEMFPHVASNGGSFVLGGSVFRQDPGYAAYRIMLQTPDDVVGVPEADEEDRGTLRLTFAPNPSPGPASIFLRTGGAGPASVTIHDLSGRRVRRLFEGFIPGRDLRLEWDLRDERARTVGSGMYFVRAQTADGTSVVKVVVGR
jgi:hypothetical protein